MCGQTVAVHRKEMSQVHVGYNNLQSRLEVLKSETDFLRPNSPTVALSVQSMCANQCVMANLVPNELEENV